MHGIGLGEIFLFSLIVILVIKPADWPLVARKIAIFIRRFNDIKANIIKQLDCTLQPIEHKKILHDEHIKNSNTNVISTSKQNTE